MTKKKRFKSLTEAFVLSQTKNPQKQPQTKRDHPQNTKNNPQMLNFNLRLLNFISKSLSKAFEHPRKEKNRMKPTHLLAAAIITALILAGLAAPAAAFSGAGSGTEADPYIITNPAELQAMADDLTAHYKLGNNIDLSSILSWTPIGLYGTPFTGVLDGDGYIISNLNIASTTTQNSNIQFFGLFGLTSGSHISNLGIEDITISATGGTAAYTAVGSIAGRITDNSIIENCYIRGFTAQNIQMTPSTYQNGDIAINGIAQGSGSNTIKNCFVYDAVMSSVYTNNPSYVGSGLGGIGSFVSIDNCYVVGISTSVDSRFRYQLSGGLGTQGAYGQTISNSVCLGSSYNAASAARITAGFTLNDAYQISNSYGLTTTLINGATVTGTTTNKNGADITTTQATTQSFYENSLGWDFDNIWYWDETAEWQDATGGLYYGLPQLQVFIKSIPPTISAISATPATGGQLTEYTLSVSATTEAAGGITGYQWAYSTDSGNTWQPISGATSATYVWTPGTSISGAVLLKCYITGADGGTIDSYESGYTNIQITIYPPPDISTISVSRPLQKVNTPTTLTATLTESEPATYQWYYSTNGDTIWQPISGATALTAEYTPTTTGTHSVKIVVTNQYGDSNELTTNFNVLPTYTPTPITNTSVDLSIDSAAKYQGMQQFTLSAELKALNYYTPTIAHLAHDNALYYLDSAEREVTPVSTTTGGTISAAYIGQYTGVITDTAGNTAFYSYQSNDWQYIEQHNAQIIASTSSYAATVSGGTISIYNLNGNLVASTATTAANLAGNDQTNVFISYSGATITYYWYQNNEIKTASKTLPHTITELHQISITSNWLISTTANTYTVSISDTGSYELLSTTDTDTPLIHTQATNINVLIGVAEPNEIFIVGADGETDGTYATGSTLNDASIAKATGLFAITGGEDRQVYILAKSTSSTWQLLQTISFGAAIDHSQISTTGTYAAVSTGLKLYLLEAVDISANTYLLQGVIIGSSGSVWANKPFTINDDNLRTDANGRFIYLVQPATLYTIVTDTTTTEYTATNAALQQIAIKLRPNPFAQSVSYSTDYNADTRNFEMIYTDTRDLTSSVTWVIRETGNQTIVSTQTVQAGQTAYWEVPLDKSFTSYQISMIADRQGTNVENVWIITPEGNPINIPGLDETGRTIIFGAVLMIFGGLFGVMHSTKGALLTVALAGIMTYLGLLNIPWVIIMVAGTIAVAAILGKGSGGS